MSRGCSRQAERCRSFFAAVTDPVGQGFVSSLQRPGGNATGFALYEYGIGAKWLELLKEIAPASREWQSFAIPPCLSRAGNWAQYRACSATGYVSKLPGNLLDHLVGAHEQELSHFYARRLRSFKINDFMRAIGS